MTKTTTDYNFSIVAELLCHETDRQGTDTVLRPDISAPLPRYFTPSSNHFRKETP